MQNHHPGNEYIVLSKITKDMSAVVPKNYSPSLLSDRRESSTTVASQPKNPKNQSSLDPAMYMEAAMSKFSSAANKASTAIIIELIVLVVAVVAIIFVIYILFNPLISSIFGNVLDTVNGLTNVTAESLGTITQTLGTVINTATGVINQVSGVGVSTISTLTNVLTTTLKTTTTVIVGDGEDNKGVLGSFEQVLKGVSSAIVGDPNDSSKIGILGQINNSIVAINEAIVGDGQDKEGVLQAITRTAKEAIEGFVDFIKEIGAVFFSVLNTIRTSMETVISGIQDGLRYLVEPFLNTSYGIPAIARTLAGVVAQFNEAIKDVSSNIKSGIDSVTSAINGLTTIF